MHRDDRTRIRHAIEAGRKAIHHAAGGRSSLDADERIAFTLIHLLEIVGEACNQVSEDFRERHRHVPWRQAIALRHRLAHGYFDVNLDIVFDTVQRDIPRLIAALERTLEE